MQSENYITLVKVSDVTGLPVAWLRAEADAGRIPCLRVGRRRLFNLEAVRRVLAERAAMKPAEVRS
ncbi:hypothetical protein RAS2_00570 [Phycisphaerae bacterium RAS2]|nr:hypothetical protein RAS2_00570 [Phycisphaerae bacterium RAS2]